MHDDNRIGKEIADAQNAPEPVDVARVIVQNLFENGPNRLPAAAKAIAIGTVAAGLTVWREQLAATGKDYKQAWKDLKEELENLKLKVAIWQKEGKV